MSGRFSDMTSLRAEILPPVDGEAADVPSDSPFIDDLPPNRYDVSTALQADKQRVLSPAGSRPNVTLRRMSHCAECHTAPNVTLRRTRTAVERPRDSGLLPLPCAHPGMVEFICTGKGPKAPSSQGDRR